MAVKPKLPGMGGGSSKGQVQATTKGNGFANPMQPIPEQYPEMGSLHNDIGEKSGFQTSGYLTKKGTPYGEAAKLNFMPPGMDINNQENCDIRDMPLKKLIQESYPGDGWEPSPRDIPE